MGFACAGGVFLFMGNLGTQYGLAFTGLSITEVVSSSITVVGGTTLNYFLDDRCETRTSQPLSLWLACTQLMCLQLVLEIFAH